MQEFKVVYRILERAPIKDKEYREKLKKWKERRNYGIHHDFENRREMIDGSLRDEGPIKPEPLCVFYTGTAFDRTEYEHIHYLLVRCHTTAQIREVRLRDIRCIDSNTASPKKFLSKEGWI